MERRVRVGGPLCVAVRVFLVPDDVLCMRTTAVKWNIAGLYGPFAEPHFFIIWVTRKDPFPSCVVERGVRLWAGSGSAPGRLDRASAPLRESAVCDSLGEWT